jgi:catabolite regulation protein CreA
MKPFYLCIFIISVLHVAAASQRLARFRKAVVSSIASLALFGAPTFGDNRVIANIQTSGFIFKDTLKVTAFSDPKVDGVTLFLR